MADDGFLSQMVQALRGKSDGPAPTYMGDAPPLASYPSEDDARAAQANGFSYGQPNAAYMDGQAGRVIGLSGGSGMAPLPPARDDGSPVQQREIRAFSPVSGAAIGLGGLLGGTVPTTNASPDGPVSQDDRDKIGLAMTRAQLAANRIPIAALGLDGHGINFDTSGQPTNIAGAYRQPTDTTYANLASDPSTLVHEAIHRGIAKLRDQPGFPQNGPGMTKPAEEYLVRHLMQHYAGDPEQEDGDIAQKQAAALYPPRQADLDQINKLAAQMLAQKRPMGPR